MTEKTLFWIFFVAVAILIGSVLASTILLLIHYEVSRHCRSRYYSDLKLSSISMIQLLVDRGRTQKCLFLRIIHSGSAVSPVFAIICDPIYGMDTRSNSLMLRGGNEATMRMTNKQNAAHSCSSRILKTARNINTALKAPPFPNLSSSLQASQVPQACALASHGGQTHGLEEQWSSIGLWLNHLEPEVNTYTVTQSHSQIQSRGHNHSHDYN